MMHLGFDGPVCADPEANPSLNLLQVLVDDLLRDGHVVKPRARHLTVFGGAILTLENLELVNDVLRSVPDLAEVLEVRQGAALEKLLGLVELYHPQN